MSLTPEQLADRESVWKRMKQEHPEFIPWMDPLNNYHAVREIVLGGSVTWRGAHERFKPEPGKLVMDIGANAGIWSAFCAANGAKVVAYEPFIRPFGILIGMMNTCGLNDHIIPFSRAVWTYTGITKYFGNISTLDNVCPAFNGSLLTSGINWTPDDEKNAQGVECVSLDDAIGDASWDMVKIDIEGAECEVLMAASVPQLKKVKFMYVEFHPWTDRELYERTIEKCKDIYNFEGAIETPDHRWEAAYLTAK